MNTRWERMKNEAEILMASVPSMPPMVENYSFMGEWNYLFWLIRMEDERKYNS